jgi:hypothetical protein
MRTPTRLAQMLVHVALMNKMRTCFFQWLETDDTFPASNIGIPYYVQSYSSTALELKGAVAVDGLHTANSVGDAAGMLSKSAIHMFRTMWFWFVFRLSRACRVCSLSRRPPQQTDGADPSGRAADDHEWGYKLLYQVLLAWPYAILTAIVFAHPVASIGALFDTQARMSGPVRGRRLTWDGGARAENAHPGSQPGARHDDPAESIDCPRGLLRLHVHRRRASGELRRRVASHGACPPLPAAEWWTLDAQLSAAMRMWFMESRQAVLDRLTGVFDGLGVTMSYDRCGRVPAAASAPHVCALRAQDGDAHHGGHPDLHAGRARRLSGLRHLHRQ